MKSEVKSYFKELNPARRTRLQTLHQVVMGLFPKATVDMKWKMPSYRFKDGWVALANQKHYISLYTCGAAHLSAFKAKHPHIKTGKGCINFGDKDPLPIEDLEVVVRSAIEQPKIPR